MLKVDLSNRLLSILYILLNPCVIIVCTYIMKNPIFPEVHHQLLTEKIKVIIIGFARTYVIWRNEKLKILQ